MQSVYAPLLPRFFLLIFYHLPSIVHDFSMIKSHLPSRGPRHAETAVLQHSTAARTRRCSASRSALKARDQRPVAAREARTAPEPILEVSGYGGSHRFHREMGFSMIFSPFNHICGYKNRKLSNRKLINYIKIN